VQEEKEAHVVLLAAAKNGESRSIGTGNRVVELFSVAGCLTATLPTFPFSATVQRSVATVIFGDVEAV
jgi:hypothetical protein